MTQKASKLIICQDCGGVVKDRGIGRILASDGEIYLYQILRCSDCSMLTDENGAELKEP